MPTNILENQTPGPQLIEVLFDTYKENRKPLPKVRNAEAWSMELYDRVAKIDRELADEIDEMQGTLAAAYELQGFKMGLKLAKSAEFQEIFGE